jgi:cytochrome c oxidase subunit 2
MPVHRSVKFELESADVIHSLWIPEMGQKQDVVPGVTQRIVITPTRTGKFTLICTELCGLGHSTMRAPVRVLEQQAFASWLDKQKAANAPPPPAGGSSGGGAGAQELGRTTFADSGCGGCHTFEPAGTDAQVGPDLDDLSADAEKAGKPLPEFIRESIVDPAAYVAEGYQPGVMPTTFGDTLKPEQLDALVTYLGGGEDK